MASKPINSEILFAKLTFPWALIRLSLATKRIGYNTVILRQTAFMVINQIMVDNLPL